MIQPNVAIDELRPPRRVDFLHGLQRIDFFRALVLSNTDDSGKAKSESTLVPAAALDAIESDFEHDNRLDDTEPPELLQRLFFEKLRHLLDFRVSQNRVRH